MLKRSLASALVALTLAASTTIAHADPITRARPTRPPEAPLLLAAPLAPLAAELDRETPPHAAPVDRVATHRRLRRSRFLIALGSGLAVTGIVGTSLYGRRGICNGYEPRHGWLPGALAAGLTTLTVGVGFTVGGTVTLLGVPRDARARDRERFHDRAGPIWLGVMTALVGTTVFAVSGLVPYIDCNNS